jgi:hypothetical protein
MDSRVASIGPALLSQLQSGDFIIWLENNSPGHLFAAVGLALTDWRELTAD